MSRWQENRSIRLAMYRHPQHNRYGRNVRLIDIIILAGLIKSVLPSTIERMIMGHNKRPMPVDIYISV